MQVERPTNGQIASIDLLRPGSACAIADRTTNTRPLNY